jgi:hypothetical protein
MTNRSATFINLAYLRIDVGRVLGLAVLAWPGGRREVDRPGPGQAADDVPADLGLDGGERPQEWA